jgi:hypothetical protein
MMPRSEFPTPLVRTLTVLELTPRRHGKDPSSHSVNQAPEKAAQ